MQKLTREEEEEQLQRTIFVGNLPATLKGKAVKRLFLECATPTHVSPIFQTDFG